MMKYPKLLTDAAHLETQTVLKATARAEAKLGELKGFVHTIPNETILLNTLPLQEAKASSEIENIVTTDDELFRSHVDDSVNGATYAATTGFIARIWSTTYSSTPTPELIS